MQIKFTTCLAGLNQTFNPGEIHDIEKAEAKRLINAGFAVAVAAKQVEKLETATVPEVDVEQATVTSDTLNIKHVPLPPKAVQS